MTTAIKKKKIKKRPVEGSDHQKVKLVPELVGDSRCDGIGFQGYWAVTAVCSGAVIAAWEHRLGGAVREAAGA